MQELKQEDVGSAEGRVEGKGLIIVWSPKTQDGSRSKDQAQSDLAEYARIADQLSALLELWEVRRSCSTKYDYVKELAGYLNFTMGLQIKLWPFSPDGERSPDILVGDLLAIEVNNYSCSDSEHCRLLSRCPSCSAAIQSSSAMPALMSARTYTHSFKSSLPH